MITPLGELFDFGGAPGGLKAILLDPCYRAKVWSTSYVFCESKRACGAMRRPPEKVAGFDALRARG